MIKQISKMTKHVSIRHKTIISLTLCHNARQLLPFSSDNRRFWLRFFGVQAHSEGIILDIFLHPEKDEILTPTAASYIDAIALYGIKKASVPTASISEPGLDFALDISRPFIAWANTRHATDQHNPVLGIGIVPRTDLPPESKLSIESIVILQERIH